MSRLIAILAGLVLIVIAAIIIAMLVMPQGLTGLALRITRRLGWSGETATLGQRK